MELYDRPTLSVRKVETLFMRLSLVRRRRAWCRLQVICNSLLLRRHLNQVARLVPSLAILSPLNLSFLNLIDQFLQHRVTMGRFQIQIDGCW